MNISKSRIKIFFKNLALWIFYLYSPLTSYRKSEKSLKPFLRKLRYQPSNQPLNTNLEVFLWISTNQEFFSNTRMSLFYLIFPQRHAKNQKNPLSRFWENCVINQPIITNNTNLIGPRWRWSKKKKKYFIPLSLISF